jgi:hypothetical protein
LFDAVYDDILCVEIPNDLASWRSCSSVHMATKKQER